MKHLRPLAILPKAMAADFAPYGRTITSMRGLLGLAAVFAAMFNSPVRAACSRTLVAAYTTPMAAEMLGPKPELGLASMPDEITALSGCPIKLLNVPTARVWASFEWGDLDLVFGATRTDDRDEAADFIPTTRFPILLVTQEPAGSIPEHLELFAARHLRVGLLRGVRLSPDAQAAVDELRKQGLLDEATDREEAYRKLEGGRDAALVAVVPPDDRPEHTRLRVIMQDQFSPLINGTYLHRANLSSEELKLLHTAIERATLDRNKELHQRPSGHDYTQLTRR